MSLSTIELVLLTSIFGFVASVLVYLLKTVTTVSKNQAMLAKDLSKLMDWFDSYRGSPLATGEGLKVHLANESVCKNEIFNRLSRLEHDVERICSKLEIPMQRVNDLPNRNPCAPAKIEY